MELRITGLRIVLSAHLLTILLSYLFPCRDLVLHALDGSERDTIFQECANGLIDVKRECDGCLPCLSDALDQIEL